MSLSPLLRLCRYRHGVQLIRPDEINLQKSSSYFYDTGYVIADLLALPFNIGFINTNAAIQVINTESAMTLGFNSIKEAIGKTVKGMVTKKSEQYILSSAQQVMALDKIILSEETLIRTDESLIHRLQIRAPWYNQQGKTIGIFGCNIELGKQALAASLSQMAQFGLFVPTSVKPFYNSILTGLHIGNTYLTKRETEISRFLIRGKIAKEIARILQISPRTVEQHVANMKNKMKVYSKAELIDKLVDHIKY